MQMREKTLEDLMDMVEMDCSGEWEPMDWQELHSPTVEVELQSEEGEKMHCQRRICDARLWNKLDDTQQRAAEAIYYGYAQMTGALSFKTRSFIKYDGGYNNSYESERNVYYSLHFREWTTAMQQQHLNIDLVINVLCEGYSCAENDKKLKIRNGTTSRNLKESLDLYSVLRGWKSKREISSK